MKYLIFSLLMISGGVCYGQTVRLQFYRTKACTVIEKLDTNYIVEPITGNMQDTTYYSPEHGIVYLPKPGRFMLFANGPLVDTAFDIRDTGLFIIHYREPDHGRYYTGAVDMPAAYSRCDSLLDGYQEYHYPNGRIEMRGVFKKGYSKDSIVTFYKNGKVRTRTFNYPGKTVIVTFDSLGNKLKFYEGGRSNISYNQYKEKYFYSNGGLKRKESSIKHLRKIKEYYPIGSLKLVLTRHYRIEYYDNGSKRFNYTWSRRRDGAVKDHEFIIRRTQYDSIGHLARLTVYQFYGELPQPDLNIKNSNWIIIDERYENDKKVLSIKDIDTDKYKQKYLVIDQEEADDNY
jgi:antitoxin component YwqK of YwqJK toxin-antitoxin module